MFKWIEYDAYISKVRNIEDHFKKIDNMLNYISNESVVTTLQNEVIEVGNLMEKHMSIIGDDNRDVIGSLESLCDHIYEWFVCNDIEKKTDLRFSILEDFNSFYLNMKNHRLPVDFAICTIIRNEAKYFEEWLEYHIYFGTKKFYIYDNESTDNIAEILKPYIDEGIVEYISWPGNEVQLSAYTDAINRFKDETGYIAFIDADEFLSPVDGISLPDTVESILRLNFNSGAVGVNWRCFGASGYEKEPDGLVIENYTLRAEDRYYENRHIKTIANPRRVTGYSVNAHEAVMKPGSFCISENGTPIIGPFFHESDCKKIRLNHYMSKSKEGFIAKHKRGWPDQPHYVPKDIDMEYKFNNQEKYLNIISDESAKKLAPVIKTMIAERK